MNYLKMRCTKSVILSTISSYVLFFILIPQASAASFSSKKTSVSDSAHWIGLRTKPRSDEQGGPHNRFTYFRKVVTLHAIPENATLLFAADSNGKLWINGHLVRRKVSRFKEDEIRVEKINATPYLHKGDNVVVVLQHNWGNITTFQRTGNKMLGLYISSSWIHTDRTWKMKRAPQFFQHDVQIKGVGGTPRIRYPEIIDARQRFKGDIHNPNFDDNQWEPAAEVQQGPWPDHPKPVETPGQREYKVSPMQVLAAGQSELAKPMSDDPGSIGRAIRDAEYHPDSLFKATAQGMLKGDHFILHGEAGETKYITYDFYRPVHGFPYLDLTDATDGIIVNFGYTEIPRSQYDGEMQVDPNTGWIDPTGVVGERYGDRYITRDGNQYVEMPDERTARWLMLQVHFEKSGTLDIQDVGIIKSQYPVEWVGTFSSGNERVNQIVKLCKIHAEITMSDAYVDTPGREDGQWYEDARLRAKIAARWFGDTRLRKFMIRTVSESQHPDGKFHVFPPTNYPFLSMYDWTMQWTAILYDQYMWSGNNDLIKTYWNNLDTYWEEVLSHVNADGLWITSNVLADIRTGVHPEKGQSSGIVTPGIIQRLRWAAQMAKAIDQDEQAENWLEKSRQMTAAFKKYHIVPEKNGIPTHVADRYDPQNQQIDRGYSQAAQSIPVFTDLISHQSAKKDLSYAFTEPNGDPPSGVYRWNNPTFSYRVLRALSHVEMSDLAVRHFIDRYNQYLPGSPENPIPLKLQGPYGGPLPEYWISREDRNLKPGEINKAQPKDDTGSHGWEAVPLLWLHDTLLGVRIEEPGGGKIRISPQSGGLPFVQGHTLTPKGKVWVSWEPRQWKLEVTLPKDVKAEIVVPKKLRGKRIRVIQHAGSVKPQPKGHYLIKGQGDYIFKAI